MPHLASSQQTSVIQQVLEYLGMKMQMASVTQPVYSQQDVGDFSDTANIGPPMEDVVDQ